MTFNQVFAKCPTCSERYSYLEIAKKEASGLEKWSDGFQMAPQRKDVLPFAKCMECDSFFWLKKNSIQEPLNSKTIKELKNYLLPDNIGRNEIDFVKGAIRSDLANSAKKEIYLRSKLWHVINHVLRKYDSQDFFSKIKHQLFEGSGYKNALKLYNYEVSLKLSNLIRLMNLLKIDQKESTNYLLFAEIYREIGDFGKAMVFGHKAKKMSNIDTDRIAMLEKNIATKNKLAYKLF